MAESPVCDPPFRSQRQKVTSEAETNPFIDLTRRTPQKTVLRGKKLTTKRSPGKQLKKSPVKSPGKGSAKSQASLKSLRNFFVDPVSSEKNVDDSFHIDLPPASQLDVSVLAALPSDMCQKILEGYTEPAKMTVPKSEGTEKYDSPTVERSGTSVQEGWVKDTDVVMRPAVHAIERKSTTRLSALERKWKESRKGGIVVGDERVFLSSWKKYIARLCNSSCDSPVSDDCERTADYLCKLAVTNLEMTELCLKSFRRFLEMQLLESPWTPAFNAILGQVQERVKSFYGGVLKVEQCHN